MTTVRITVPAGPTRHVVIGRGRHCHVRVADPNVSRLHAKVTNPATGRYRITDLGSTNGTRVLRGLNDYTLHAGDTMDLVRGDWLIIGTTWFVLGDRAPARRRFARINQRCTRIAR